MTIHHTDVRDVSAAEAQSLAARGALLLDVRERHEWVEAHIPDSTLSSLGRLNPREFPDDRLIVTVCRSGSRSRVAAELLIASGHRNVVNLAGGLVGWHAAGLPLVSGDSDLRGAER